MRVQALARFIQVSILSCSCLLLSALPLSLAESPSTSSKTQSPEVAEALEKGVELERSEKWLQAIEHYESSLKKHPSTVLEYGLRRSKIHYAIGRRYGDASFSRSITTMDRDEAMQTFEEVLGKIQISYVDPLSATSFVAHGTESLYLALADQKFLDRNLPNTPSSDIVPFRKLLRERYWNKPVGDRSTAVSTVREVTALAEEQLRLAPGPVIMEYVIGGCNALDDYSCYLTSGRLKDLYNNIDGQFVGLGIEMKAESGKGMLLMAVLPGSPAEEGGLLAGERIVGISGRDCRNMGTDSAAQLLQGREGTEVNLEILGKGDKIRKGTFTRRPVDVKSVPIAQIIDREHGIAYLQMTGFQKNTSAELDSALTRLQSEGMRALIWDVRGNPGGLLTAAVEVLDRFIGDGVLVSTRGRKADQNWSYSAHRSGTTNVPLVLLTDGDSASASEIVAGAIRDHRRGTIVGRRTFGKWSVQTILNLDSSTAGLRLTTAKFYSPNGHTLSKVGVQPDIELPEPNKERGFFRPATDVNLAEDTDLLKGIEILQGKYALKE